MTEETEFEVDVLVVGSGPTGATAALALATLGVPCHMVSMWNWQAHTPRAHIINLRTMEVFRDLGIEDDVLLNASPWDVMGDTLFTTSLAGPELARMRTWGTGDDRKGDYVRASPCHMVDIIQPILEPLLLKHAAARGASFAFNTEYVSHAQDETGLTVRLRDRLSNREYAVRAKYLVGADGARSPIFEALGLPLEGQLARAGTVYVSFKADLSAYVAHRPSILNWIVTPLGSFGEIGMGLLRAVKPWTEWIAGWGFDISKGDPDLSPELVRDNILAMIGDTDVEIEIERNSVWYVNQAYAPQYSKGRVFCGGDAVHRHPPSSGLGLNTCVQDAFNLAWKLAYVVKGYAGPELLETYSEERAPVGKQIVARANQSRLDYAAMNACFRKPGESSPVVAGTARFRDPGPEGVAARKAFVDALDLKQTEFNALGVEMNQRYSSRAVLTDAGAEPEVWVRDKQLYLQATTRPGAKTPHAWLVGRDGRRVSTLDVVGKGKFTVLTGLAGGVWKDAAQKLALSFVRVVVTDTPRSQDLYREWQGVREVDEDGVILVRPDGYVAWRQQSAPADFSAAAELLRAALAGVLGNFDGDGWVQTPEPEVDLRRPQLIA